jgi:hypothetical protein
MLRIFGNPYRLWPEWLPVFLMAILLAPAVANAAPSSKTAALSPLLPPSFAGWQIVGTPVLSAQPQAADGANADVLTECGFEEFESAQYSTSDNHLSVRAIRFGDASGTDSAFTFYRRQGSIPEEIGHAAAWDGAHMLFWQGATLIDATFDHVTAMSASELRDLGGAIAQPLGSSNIVPSLPTYLPRTGLTADRTRYALGEQTYVRGGGVLPPSLVDFAGGSAEAVTGSYSGRDGDGKLTLLEYPTPQLAAARLDAINAFLKQGNAAQSAWPQELAESHPDALLTRRSGPIVAITSGSFPAATARSLLGQVNYQADVTWNNPKGYIGEGSKVARLLISVIELFAIVGGAAILLGLFLGGGRALVRVLRGKSASALDEDTEIIRLNLKD